MTEGRFFNGFSSCEAGAVLVFRARFAFPVKNSAFVDYKYKEDVMQKKFSGRKLISVLVAVMLVFAMMPAAAFAQDSGVTVNVKIENVTFTEDAGSGEPAWTGALLDAEVTVPSGTTMAEAVETAAAEKNISLEKSSYGYISSVDGLEAGDAGMMSGWMMTLNDWFSDATTYKVEDGDEVILTYSVTGGDDLGAFWDNNDKTVKALDISRGELSPSFSSDIKEYTLSLDSEVSEIYIVPVASNKYFQVRAIVNDKEYKANQPVPVEDGTVIEVTCGDPSWPTSNSYSGAGDVPAETYVINVEMQDTVDVTIRNQVKGEYLNGFAETVSVSAGEAEDYGLTDKTDGVSSLDALVKAHEMIYGEDFTADNLSDYIEISSSGWVTKVFGQETSDFSFLINQGYPNVDGVGTTVNDQEILDGDVIDFIIYSDSMAYMDYYTWIDAPSKAQAGEEITVTVSAISACYEAYLFATPEEMKAAADPLPDAEPYEMGTSPQASLVWVDAATGKTEPVENSMTDDKGQVTFTVPEDMESGEYYLAAQSVIVDEDDVFANTYIIKNPSKIHIDPADVSLTVTADSSMDKVSLYAGDDENKTDLLADVQPQDGKYRIELAPGRYVIEGFARSEGPALSRGADMISLGTIEVFVDEENTALDVMTVKAGCADESWIRGEDYTAENLTIRAASASESAYRNARFGEDDGALTFLVLKGDTYSFDVVPQGDKAGQYQKTTVTGTVNSAEDTEPLFTPAEKEPASDPDRQERDKALKEVYEKTGDYLAGLISEEAPTVSTVGGDWIITGLSRAGYEISDSIYQQYYNNVCAYVKENINENEQLHRSRSTDNSRVILALTAIGADPTDVAGHNLLAGIADMNYIQKQGINGVMYALIAFDSHDYEIPQVYGGKDQATREKMISLILDSELEGGGWSLAGSVADTDMTAIGIQALAPYYDSDDEVKAAVDRALQVLSQKQTDNGGYGSFEAVNIESSAQVLAALSALGIDPDEDVRFIKDGNTVLDAMLGYAVEDGGFEHIAGHGLDQLATEQGYYALTSYYRVQDGKTSLYDMSDVNEEEGPLPDQSQTGGDSVENDGNVQTGDAGEGGGKDAAQSSLAKTGDSSDLGLAAAVLLTAAACTAFAAYRRKEDNQ